MTKKIGIDAITTIQEGQEFVTHSITGMKKGQRVEICRSFLGVTGKPIAKGVCVMNMKDDAKSPTTPTSGGKKANTWRNYYKILVERILK